MNIKAEKLEQIMQIVNRNLHLVQADQENDVIPFEFRNLQKIDTGVFGADKFAFEMVHFVKSTREVKQAEDSLLARWEKCFLKGLETLLVECGLVKDEVERDCFVSRVYCWFSEKISERRQLPRPPLASSVMNDIRESVKNLMGPDSSTLKAMDAYTATVAAASDKVKHNWNDGDEPQMAPLVRPNSAPAGKRANSSLYTMVPQILTGQRGPISPTLVSRPKSGDHSMRKYMDKVSNLLPPLPSAENNYGMVYHMPETESELVMHELWLSRRRQEAFDWKAQQQIHLLMDRIGLHKSRVESETLRRQESGSYLAAPNNPNSPSRNATGVYSSSSSMQVNVTHKSASRFVPDISGERPLSAKRQNLLAARGAIEGGERVSPKKVAQDGSPDLVQGKIQGKAANVLRESVRVNRDAGDIEVSDVQITADADGLNENSIVSKMSRTAVAKLNTVTAEGKKGYVPMRFGDAGVTTRTRDFERQHYYMQVSDSEEEDDNEKKKAKKPVTRQNMSSTLKSRTNVLPPIKPVRERPTSSKRFKEISFNDPESKVYYRHTNYRRMPLTTEQQQWLTNVEEERVRKQIEYEKQLAQKQEEKDAKTASKGKGKDKKPAKATGAMIKSGSAGGVSKKYNSAEHFMAVNFPTFDVGASQRYAGAKNRSNSAPDIDKPEFDLYNLDDINDENFGPMRTMQLVECNQIIDACKLWEVPIDKKALYRALIIPQDKPDAITLEQGLRNENHLTLNPLPKDKWRTPPAELLHSSKKKKAKKGKKK